MYNSITPLGGFFSFSWYVLLRQHLVESCVVAHALHKIPPKENMEAALCVSGHKV